jgi:hypothetical protein
MLTERIDREKNWRNAVIHILLHRLCKSVVFIGTILLKYYFLISRIFIFLTVSALHSAVKSYQIAPVDWKKRHGL